LTDKLLLGTGSCTSLIYIVWNFNLCCFIFLRVLYKKRKGAWWCDRCGHWS